jgi:hypothetical protein
VLDIIHWKTSNFHVFKIAVVASAQQAQAVSDLSRFSSGLELIN